MLMCSAGCHRAYYSPNPPSIGIKVRSLVQVEGLQEGAGVSERCVNVSETRHERMDE